MFDITITVKKIVLIVAVFIASIFFLSFVGFYIHVRPVKIRSNLTPANLNLPYQELWLVTKDDLKLHAWFIPNKNKQAAAVILLHGFPADKSNILPLMYPLHQHYNLLLFDFRYLGKSEGHYTTLGIKEVEDTLAAIRYLKKKGIKKIAVWGFSMGAAVALMTAARSTDINAVVADSSYASLDKMAYELYKLPVIRYAIGELIDFWSWLFLGLRLKEAAPVDAASKITAPVLLIHAKNDNLIPFSHALALQKALKHNSKVETYFIKAPYHGRRDRYYYRTITDFLQRNM